MKVHLFGLANENDSKRTSGRDDNLRQFKSARIAIGIFVSRRENLLRGLFTYDVMDCEFFKL